MENFQYCIGTNILFGKGQIEHLPQVLGPYGRKVLLVYGGGSIRRSGLYDKIHSLLADFTIFELSGIDPNPRIESVSAGAQICKTQGIEVILAVGGGSTIDCAKAIAVAACYDGDAWDLVMAPDKIQGALPLCTILTLAATGSEMNAGSVISNPAAKQKVGFMHELLLPKASILDPEYTYTVSARQTAAGAVDIFSHILEQYFTHQRTFLSDRLCESILKTVIHYAPIAVHEPENYEARGQLMWANSLADNGITSLGNQFCAWSCHGIEHALSGQYDVTHGVGLAIITPRWMRFILNEGTVERLAEYGANVWGIDPALDKYKMAEQGIASTEAFFQSLGLPMRLSELGIDDRDFEAMAATAVSAEGLAYAYVPLNAADVVSILKLCL